MEQKSYLNFDLLIEEKGERFMAKVIDSPAGQSAIEFDAPFSHLELENLVLRMGQAKKGFRRIDSPELEAAKFFGSKLFQTIFIDDVGLCFQRSKDYAASLQKGIRIRLRINIPEFQDYPWEFLYNTQLNQFLALSKDTPLIRYMELPYPGQVLSVKPPLRILVMISSPDGYEPIDVESEWESSKSYLAAAYRQEACFNRTFTTTHSQCPSTTITPRRCSYIPFRRARKILGK